MKCKISHAGHEIKINEVDKKPDYDKLKINNPTLDRAKRIYSLLREEMGK